MLRDAPSKHLTIPKLELCATVLGCKLLDHTRKALQKVGRNSKKIFGWMDRCHDCTLLNQRDPKRLEHLFRNLVLEVQETLKPFNWRFVRNEEKPAGRATHGLDAMTHKMSSLSWHGPSWLSELWLPYQAKLAKLVPKKIAVVNSSQLVKPSLDAIINLGKLSSLQK